MKKPPPGMKSMPLKPGETKSQYMDRVRATKPTTPVRSGINDGLGNGVRGSVNGVRGSVNGGVKGSMAPIDSGRGAIPKPKGGAGTGGGRGTAPRPGYGGAKPKAMKSGGMVKGKK